MPLHGLEEIGRQVRGDVTLERQEGADTHLVEGGEDETHEAVIQHLIHGLQYECQAERKSLMYA